MFLVSAATVSFMAAAAPPPLLAVDLTAAEKKKVAIFDFTPNNVPESYARIVRNAIEVSLYSTGYFQLIEKERISRVLKERNIKMLAISDKQEMVSLGRSLVTDYMIMGSLDRIKDYTIVIRVVSVSDGSIVVAYSKQFSDAGDIDSVADKLSQRVSEDLKKFIETGVIKAAIFDTHHIMVGARFNYVYPLRAFGRLVNPGFGFALDFGMDNIGIDNLTLGLEFGYYHFSGRENRSDQCNFIHLMAALGYRISPVKKFYIHPNISAGISFNYIKHGGGSGFNMKENSEKTVTEPIMKAGVSLAFIPMKLVHVGFGAKYGFVIETEDVMDFVAIDMGVTFVF
jgi:hypothetical protein